MNALNQILKTNINLMQWEDIKNLCLELQKLFTETDLPKLQDKLEDFKLGSEEYFKDTFLYLQSIIEHLDYDLDTRIELTNDIANVLSFLQAVKNLPQEDYEKYKDQIYFEFVLIIGNHYLTRLNKTLRNCEPV